MKTEDRAGIVTGIPSAPARDRRAIRKRINELCAECDPLDAVIGENTVPYANPTQDQAAGRAYEQRSELYRRIADLRRLLGIDPQSPFPGRRR